MQTKVAIIYNSSDTYSSGIYQTFATEANAKGLDVVAAEAFTADNKTDFSVQIQKAKDAGAELVFLPIYYQEASLILAQAKQSRILHRNGSDVMVWMVSLILMDLMQILQKT